MAKDCHLRRKGGKLMDLFAEMTRTDRAQRWWEENLAAFEDDEPVETQSVDLETEEAQVVHINGRTILLGKIRPPRKLQV